MLLTPLVLVRVCIWLEVKGCRPLPGLHPRTINGVPSGGRCNAMSSVDAAICVNHVLSGCFSPSRVVQGSPVGPSNVSSGIVAEAAILVFCN